MLSLEMSKNLKNLHAVPEVGTAAATDRQTDRQTVSHLLSYPSRYFLPAIPAGYSPNAVPFFASGTIKTEQKIRPGRADWIFRSKKCVPHVPTAFFGAKNAVGMDFLMKSTRNRRNSSNLWQNYDTAKVGAMVIHVLNMAGMHRWCRLLAT